MPASMVSSDADRVPLTLLVDRDVDTRQMYAEYLRQFLCDIDEAEDGREALAKAISRRPDVIVTETRLPGISGFDLCSLLRRDETTREIPIIVVTADAFESDLRRARKAGADAVLVKPCLPEHLAAEIRSVLAETRALRQRAAAARETAAHETHRAIEAIDRSEAVIADAHVSLRSAHRRRETTAPPLAPLALLCPHCDGPLSYVKSYVGGVSKRQQEQWDYFECAAGCGTYQYRQRTRKLRRV